MPSNRIYGVNQDRQGYIWIATDRGIAKFNGKTFTAFTLKEGLSTNDVFYFFIDPENKIWLFDYSSYLTYLNRDTIHKLKVYPDTTIFFKTQFFYENNNVFISVKDGHIVMANSNNASIMDADSFLSKNFIPRDYTKDSVNNYLFFTQHRIGTITKDGVYVKDLDNNRIILYKYNKNIDSFPYKTGLLSSKFFANYIVGPLRDEHNYAFFNILNGRYKTIDFNKYLKGFTHARVYDVYDRAIQISTNVGLLVIDSSLQIVDRYERGNDLKGVNINSYFRDEWGNFWINTINDGIYFISSELRSFTNAPINDILKKGSLSNIYYSDNHYFLFNEHNELFITDSNYHSTYHFQLRSGSDFFSDLRNYFLIKDGDRGHYIISPISIYYIDNQYRLIDIMERFPAQKDYLKSMLASVKDCILDKEDQSVILSNHNDVFKLKYDGAFHISFVMHRRFINLHKDLYNRYWMSNDLGELAIFDRKMKEINSYNIKNRLTQLFTDQYNNIILVIDGRGVICFNLLKQPASYIYYGNDIQLVNADSSGIWVSTHNFIKKFEYRNGKYMNTSSFLNLKGLLYQEVYRVYSRQDSFYILCDKGILRCHKNYRSTKANQFTKSLFLSHISFGTKEELVLNAHDSVIEHGYTRDNVVFKITCNSTAYFGNVQYYYYLEGNETSWQSSQEDNISYPALEPGTYTLHYMAAITNSDIITAEKKYTIIITPLWWQSWWFRSVLILLIAGLVGLAIYLRIQFIKQREEANTERNKKMAELELSALQAQMNPHFTFNALSSIQSFIKTNEAPSATELLQKFSLLMRLYLEFSRHKKISLKQEIRALQLYTDIERLRFNNRFDVQINIRSTQSIETILIPPMMIQPLVENAINHGLYHKQGSGLLKILFWIRKSQIVVFIDDNGIGREKAKKLRSKLFPSRGNKIIKDRIEVLKASGLADSSVVITDKYDKDTIPSGTRVILTMNLS